ncbi:MAG TPA: hypothetical protein VMU66_05485, partial [Gaiellales bacterium]|nr:hypothetical protein [Gaiellales bacterium]
DFLAPLRPGRAVAALHGAVRERSAHLERDRSLSAEVEALAADLRDGSVLRHVETAAGPLR